jgi:hypothetical protein
VSSLVDAALQPCLDQKNRACGKCWNVEERLSVVLAESFDNSTRAGEYANVATALQRVLAFNLLLLSLAGISLPTGQSGVAALILLRKFVHASF